jgi:hypothetical protein
MTRTLIDPLSGRQYVLADGRLRRVSPWPVDKGQVQRLVVARLKHGQLVVEDPRGPLKGDVERLNARYFSTRAVA